ncbi:pterin 4 alpha carbinolamine dehydratase, putative [Leishmania tarentolae]|uniref:Pterin 4 alpha carbinolamine dehydratase, putative n=1 Tax=Leishmania tarentolae TaxID=5689 RepID=A0A640KB88_LEITA|nr:pterin 4 alpha carbinolamine dehydratase, putative [Leishmania tarentolae]
MRRHLLAEQLFHGGLSDNPVHNAALLPLALPQHVVLIVQERRHARFALAQASERRRVEIHRDGGPLPRDVRVLVTAVAKRPYPAHKEICLAKGFETKGAHDGLLAHVREPRQRRLRGRSRSRRRRRLPFIHEITVSHILVHGQPVLHRFQEVLHLLLAHASLVSSVAATVLRVGVVKYVEAVVTLVRPLCVQSTPVHGSGDGTEGGAVPHSV